MTDQPTITNVSGEVTIRMQTSFHPDILNFLLPHWKDLQDYEVVADLRAADNNRSIVVTIISLDDPNSEPWIEIVVWLIQHIWMRLVALKIVDGPMPNID